MADSLRQTPHQRDLMARLQRRLKVDGINLRDAASSLGCNVSTLSRLINGNTGLNARREADVIGFLGIQPQADAQMLRLIGELETGQIEILLQIMQQMLELRTRDR